MTESKLSRAIEMMIKTDHMHKALIDTRVKTLGIHRTQHRILMHLARHDKLPSQKELAEHLQISPTAIAVKIKKLESDGFIEREKQSGDSRFNKVSITDKGMDIVKRTECIFGGIDSKMIEGLSPDEIDNFIIITEKLRANLENLLKDGESAK